jgi:hypothetical protein
LNGDDTRLNSNAAHIEAVMRNLYELGADNPAWTKRLGNAHKFLIRALTEIHAIEGDRSA